MSIRIAASASQKRSPHALATEAINTLIEQSDCEHAFNQICDAAYNEYKESGLHVTHEELVPWMESLFSDNELPSPACHA